MRNLAILLGKIAKEEGDPRLYEEAIDLAQESYLLSVERGDDQEERDGALFSLANLQRKAERFDVALENFRELHRLTESDREPSIRWVDANYGAGRCLQSLGRFEEALAYAEQAVDSAVPLRKAVRDRCQDLLEDLLKELE
jgi:tetratricopeptide (TPR) repeat protein